MKIGRIEKFVDDDPYYSNFLYDPVDRKREGYLGKNLLERV